MFDLIRDAAGSNELVCLHSLGIARHRRKDYAEADFVLIAPGGIFCLEVKGGAVERREGLWRIGQGTKSYVSREGPFKQAQSARWALLDYLDRRLERRLRDECVVGWGVAFPDIRFDQLDPEWDNDVVYDQRDATATFVRYVDRLGHYFANRATEIGRRHIQPMSRALRDKIVDALRGDFEVVRSLRGLLVASEQELVALSADQHRVLDYALNDRNPRIICDGPAGTGKTLIALEAARRLAGQGAAVLVLCYNDNLGRFIKIDASRSAPGVHVSTLHSFFADLIRRGGLGDRLMSGDLEAGSRFFDETYPDLFQTACSILCDDDALPQYEVVIIDEAQDVLTPAFMNCLDLILSGGFRQGRWLIFHDSGLQSAVYDRADAALLENLRSFGAASFELKENFRNPKEIAQEASTVAGAAEPICRRSLRSPVEYRTVSDARDQAKRLRALLLELLQEGVRPGDVSILSPVRTTDACVGRFPPDIGKSFRSVAETGERNDDTFTVSTISGFKGLENEIIVLTDLPETLNDEWARAAIYVGMTRARTKLYAFVGNDYLEARANR